MNRTNNDKRVTVKLECPNPLFEKWLAEWRDQAKEKNSKTQHAYSLALQSLRKYPLPLEKGRDCKILKGFGNKLCERLDDTLKKFRNGEPAGNINNKPTSSKKSERTKDKLNEYVPTYKSGSYAILVTLYKETLETNSQGFMYKKDLIKAAQPVCETSLTKAEPGSFYTAWNCMKTLLSKNLVKKVSNPAKFSLTNEGILLAHKLHTGKVSTDNLDVPSTICSTGSEIENIATKKIFMDEHLSMHSVESDNENEVFDAEAMKNLKFPIPEPVTAPSSELRGICGTFSSIENEEKDRVKSGNHQDVFLTPYSFDIVLYVDTNETNGGQIEPQDDPILAELIHLNVKYEVKNLKVGDYCWICRDKTSKEELVTPYVIERKRMDDLASSIKDGRFHEQKFRLKQCGLQNVIYMIENYGKNEEHVGLPLSSLYQATVNTLIQDGFCVKFVEGTRGVAEYLSCMSNLIKKNYETKTIASCPKENISKISIGDDLVSLMYFKEFNQLSSKAKSFTVKEMFIRQLLQVKGLSIDKALAIVEAHPTPQILRNMIEENQLRSINIISNLKYGKLGKKIGPLLSTIIYQLFAKITF